MEKDLLINEFLNASILPGKKKKISIHLFSVRGYSLREAFRICNCMYFHLCDLCI